MSKVIRLNRTESEMAFDVPSDSVFTSILAGIQQAVSPEIPFKQETISEIVFRLRNGKKW